VPKLFIPGPFDDDNYTFTQTEYSVMYIPPPPPPFPAPSPGVPTAAVPDIILRTEVRGIFCDLSKISENLVMTRAIEILNFVQIHLTMSKYYIIKFTKEL
jgi:hypothetical protein